MSSAATCALESSQIAPALTVRRATADDLSTVVDFQIQLALESEQLELDRATVELGVSAVLHDPTKGAYWLAQSGSEVAGSLLVMPEWSDWSNRTVLWIHSVYVRPEMRKLGVFKVLFTYLREMVEADATLKGVRLYVDKRNLSAQQVYERLQMSREHYHLYEWMK
jgi:GNAT superfamily N-acetyltransferase